jgi:hypothetical protein
MPARTAQIATALALCALHAPLAGAAALCSRWSEPAQVGELDVVTIMEASGIAVSRRTPPRLYHINDGSRAQFFVTNPQGGNLQTVRMNDFTPQDIEDIGLGPCGSSTCLFVADIGDNAVQRQSVQIATIREPAAFSAAATPEKVITARYPNGPHDAEAIAIHPASGDLLLAAKVKFIQQQQPSQLFRLSAAQLAAGGEQLFEAVGTIPVAALSESLGSNPRRVITAMDYSPDGNRLLLLTYDAFIEIALGSNAALPDTWAEGQTHRATAIAPLLQAEAIAYDRDGQSIIYNTESIRGSAAPLMKQICQD